MSPRDSALKEYQTEGCKQNFSVTSRTVDLAGRALVSRAN
jgi:hypothetical protein